MAVYKVPQDVEADDKLIGPFSFKQFVFILIAVAVLWFTYVLVKVTPIFGLVAILAIPFLILGLPLRKEQPTDVYVAALINYVLRPKVRTWNQEGMIERVLITVPKKTTKNYSDGLSRTEVKSRLSSLANTMDTRGWSAKNVDPITARAILQQSDRLVAPVEVPPQVIDDHDVEDIMDARSSKVAQNFARLETEAAAKRGDVNAAQALNPEQVNETPAQVFPGTVVMPTPGAPAPEPIVETPTPDNLSAGAPNYDAYPDIKQSTINPLHSRDELQEPKITPQGADIINSNPSSAQDMHDEGGEITLR